MDTPSNGTRYYFVDERGEIETATWEGSQTDKNRLQKNNAFLNKDQAQRELSHSGGGSPGSNQPHSGGN